MVEKKGLGKWVIARFQHETNTFSPIPTPLEAFNPFWDQDAYRDQENAQTGATAMKHQVMVIDTVGVVWSS